MRMKIFIFILPLIIGARAVQPAQTSDPKPVIDSGWEARCKALPSTEFSGIADAPAQITAANTVEASKNLPAHCKVQGYVWPQIGFQLALPATDWNVKFLEPAATVEMRAVWPLDAAHHCKRDTPASSSMQAIPVAAASGLTTISRRRWIEHRA